MKDELTKQLHHTIYTVIISNREDITSPYTTSRRVNVLNRPLLSFLNEDHANSYRRHCLDSMDTSIYTNFTIKVSEINITDLENKILVHFIHTSNNSRFTEIRSKTEYKENLPTIMRNYPQAVIGHLMIDKFQLMALKGLT